MSGQRRVLVASSILALMVAAQAGATEAPTTASEAWLRTVERLNAYLENPTFGAGSEVRLQAVADCSVRLVVRWDPGVAAAKGLAEAANVALVDLGRDVDHAEFEPAHLVRADDHVESWTNAISIFLTSDIGGEFRSRVLGEDEFVTKPWDPEKVTIGVIESPDEPAVEDFVGEFNLLVDQCRDTRRPAGEASQTR